MRGLNGIPDWGRGNIDERRKSIEGSYSAEKVLGR